METLLHILGLCPDSNAHPDIINLLFMATNEIKFTILNLLSWKR